MNELTTCVICKEGTHKPSYPMCWNCSLKPVTDESKEALAGGGWIMCKMCNNKLHKDRFASCWDCLQKPVDKETPF